MTLMEIFGALWDALMLLILIKNLRFRQQLGPHYLGKYSSKIEEVRVLLILCTLLVGVGVFAVVVIPIELLGYLVAFGLFLPAATLGMNLVMCVTSRDYLPNVIKNIGHSAQYYVDRLKL